MRVHILEKCSELLKREGVHYAVGSVHFGRIDEIFFSLGYEVDVRDKEKVEENLRDVILKGLKSVPGAPSWFECTLLTPGEEVSIFSEDIEFNLHDSAGSSI